MKTKNLRLNVCLALLLIAASSVSAASFTAAFPSASSTVIASVGLVSPNEYGYFWSVSRGDSISQTFTGTGLITAQKLDLSFPITRNVLSSEVDWDVLVNSVTVGSWKWTPADGVGPFNASYSFPGITGNGTYSLVMRVSNEVPGGNGSIAIGFPGSMTLQDVPEPGACLLLLGGMLFVGINQRKRSESELSAPSR